jgi:uncharacterized protein YndB with AHSA1/START domain
MATLQRDIRIATAPDAVWALVGDPGRLAEWWPVASCRMEGSTRWVGLATGLVFEESILLVDPERRRLQYSIVNNPLIRDHLATVDVIADGDGSTVVYETTCLPDVLALVNSGASGAALREAKRILEADA